MNKILLLALAGSLGALARAGLAGAVNHATGTTHPWGTMVVNLVGCLLAGLVYAAAEERLGLSREARTIVLVGFMGAFTTFSSFMLESGELFRAGQWWLGAGNIAGQNLLGVSLFFLGMALGRAL